MPKKPLNLCFDTPIPATETLEEAFQKKHHDINTIDPDDTVHLADLGAGISGIVTKVKHIPTNDVLARKMIRVEMKPSDRNRIIQELSFLKDCKSDFIVKYLSACHRNGEINLFMEYMDGNSLSQMLKKVGKIPEDILGKVTVSVVEGLTYLKETKNIMHRDIKPSNILINSSGYIKICDFGVSKQLEDSIAVSFVGTKHYMAPERLTGSPYTVQSDIWSLGLTLVELALGVYPIPQDDPKRMYEEGTKIQNTSKSIFEVMDDIVVARSPTIPIEYFSQEFKDLVDNCLEKIPRQRYDLRTIREHIFVKRYQTIKVDIAGWVCKACTGLN